MQNEIEVQFRNEKRDTDNRNRFDWIDVAKGIGIILVVWAHALPKDTVIWGFINQFHMPLFFMLSGYLYTNKKSWGDFIVRKIRNLWLPFVSSSIVTTLISIIIGTTRGGIIFWVKKVIKTILLLEAGPLLGAIWFLRVLFYGIIIYDLLVRFWTRICGKYNWLASLSLSAILLYIGISTNLPFGASVVLNSIAYINAGKAIKENEKNITWISLPLSIVMLMICFIISLYNRVSYVNNIYTNPLLFILASFCGVIGLLMLCKYLGRIRVCIIIKYLGKNSIGPMIWHFVTFKIVICIQILCYKLPWNRLTDFPVIYEYANGLWVLLYVFLGLTVSLAIYDIFNRPIDNVARRVEKRYFGK